MTYKLSPSDFAYLYEECKLCYVLKVKYGIYQPSMPMPGVFSTINSHLQGTLVGKNLRTLSSHLPDGMVESQEGWVDSKEIDSTCVYIKGKYDLLVRNSDGTHTLIDLKISQPGEDKIEKYRTQLSAYKYALENPKMGPRYRISRLALLIFYPDSVTFENGKASLHFPPKWFEVSYHEESFIHFIKGIHDLLSGPLPTESPSCKWCIYRHTGEKLAHKLNPPKPRIHQEDIPF